MKQKKLIGEILRIAYPHARDELSSTIGLLLDQDIRDGKHVVILKRVMDCWNSSIASVILERAKNKDLDAPTLRSLLDVLLSRGVEEARTYAKSLMSEDELTLPDRRARVVSAAVVLIQREQDAGWPLIWPMIKHNVVFGKEVLEATAFFPGDGKSFLDRLNEECLGNLYAWLVNQYGDNDQALVSAGFSNPSHTISMLEHGILNTLKARGNSRSVAVLTSLVAELPQIKWLKFYVLDAQNITRRQTWVPLNPTQFLALSANTQSRTVQNAGQLLNVVIESLQRLQTKLHAEVPAVEFLWIPSGSNTFKPRKEESLSNYIKIHLDEDLKGRGVVINREVQIHLGQRTDIHIDAWTKEYADVGADVITLIVEVKGSWNEDLNHGMQTQLVDKYLRDSHCDHGLYVVGWFASDSWDTNDWRRAKTPKLSVGEAQSQFNAQAQELSTAVLSVKALVLDVTLRYAASGN